MAVKPCGDDCIFRILPDGTSKAGPVLWRGEGVYATLGFADGGLKPNELLILTQFCGDKVFDYPAFPWFAFAMSHVAAMPALADVDWRGEPPHWMSRNGYDLPGFGDPEPDGPNVSGRTIAHDHVRFTPRVPGLPSAYMGPTLVAATYDRIVLPD